MASLEALNHWMLQDDRLAREFDGILKLSPYYDAVRLAGIRSEISFFAPLTADVNSPVGQIKGEFLRNSEGTYRAPLGTFFLSALDNESRHEYAPNGQALGLLIEEPSTNKCTNYNANPDEALINIDQIGDPAAVFTRAQDTEELAAAGLAALCNSGFVLKLDNSAGVSNAAITILGSSGNTNPHTISAYCRTDPASAGAVRLIFAGGSGVLVDSETYQRFFTSRSGSDSSRLELSVEPGGIGYMILNQLEEQPKPTSMIITEGATTSRAIDQLDYPLAGDPKGPEIFSESITWDNNDPGAITIEGDVASWDGSQPGNASINTASAFGMEAGSFYEITYEVISRTAGQHTVGVEPTSIFAPFVTDTGRRTVILRPTVADSTLYLWGDGNFVGQISLNVSVRKLTPILNQAEGMAAMSWIPHFGDEDIGLSTQTILLNTTTIGTTFLYFRKLSGAGVNRFQSFDGLNTAHVDILPELVANQLYLIVMRWTATAFQIGYKLNGAWAWGPEIAHQAWAEEDNLFLLPLASSNAPLNSNSKNVYLWLEDKGQAWLEEFFSGAAN